MAGDGGDPTAADDQVLYVVSLLWSALSPDDVQRLERGNKAVLDFCREASIECKQYLPHYTSQDGWQQHFGAKWGRIAELKDKYDPHTIVLFVWACLTYKPYFFSQRTLFFSHTKSANSTFSHDLSVKQAKTNKTNVRAPIGSHPK